MKKAGQLALSQEPSRTAARVSHHSVSYGHTRVTAAGTKHRHTSRLAGL